MQPLAVGLVGAGPWAGMVHAPLLAAGPETRLAGIWSRTESSARALADSLGVPAFATYAELLDASEAVSFAVAPTVQPDLAIEAARRGKAVLLEKPLAVDMEGAERLVAAVEETGVGSLVFLTYRFSAAARRFLSEAEGFAALGGRGCFLSGAFLGGPFSVSPWRHDYGALLDVGPHIIDLLDAALGSVEDVRAHGRRDGWVGLLLTHAGGTASEVSICSTTAIDPGRTEVEIYGPAGRLALSRDAVGPDAFATLRADFARVARSGEAHPADARRGLHLQRIVAEASAQLQA